MCVYTAITGSVCRPKLNYNADTENETKKTKKLKNKTKRLEKKTCVCVFLLDLCVRNISLFFTFRKHPETIHGNKYRSLARATSHTYTITTIISVFFFGRTPVRFFFFLFLFASEEYIIIMSSRPIRLHTRTRTRQYDTIRYTYVRVYKRTFAQVARAADFRFYRVFCFTVFSVSPAPSPTTVQRNTFLRTRAWTCMLLRCVQIENYDRAVRVRREC